MAEQQTQNTETQEAQNPILRAQNNEAENLYWCYQCNKEVNLEHHEGEAQMLCSECHCGFVEALVSAEGVVPRDRRGRRPRRMFNRAFNSTYQRNVLRALRLIAENAQLNARIQRVRARDGTVGNGDTQSEGQVNPQDRSLGDTETNFGHPDGGFVDGRENLGHRQNAVADNHRNFGHPEDASVESQPISGNPESASDDNQPNLGHPQAESADNQPNLVQSQSADASENGNNMVVDAGESLEDDDDEAGDDNVFNIELDMWDSFEYDDEDEDGDEDDEEGNDTWEEVAEGYTTEGQDEEPGEGVADFNSGENNEEINQGGVDGQRRSNTRRDVLRLRIRDWNSQSPGAVLESSGRNLDLDWNEIMQALENNSIELRLSLPEEDTYFGNPGDYVDDVGYEILLQNFAENDNTHKGAPPAAKSAIEGLPSVAIDQQNIDSADAMCAICKEIISLGDTGKQLPCQHLYHGHCIIPWLNYRNSCPICRYELPTDDADYEEQKKQRTISQSTVSDSGMVSPEGGLS